jgi:hypothetical protein
MTIYSPLDGNIQEIRLLELQPAEEPGAPLCGILRPVSLASSPTKSTLTYETISYVWGKPEFDKSMFVAGQALPITSRVEHMLTKLRYKNKTRTLWIDSICIDQSNMHERSQQILLMRKVYSEGQHNIAYITQPSDGRRMEQNIQKGMEIMKKICSKDNATLATFRKENEWFFQGKRAMLKRRSNDSDLVLDDDAGKALSSFLQARHRWSFWGRIWIVQEMALAKKVTLMCEDAELDWDLISSFLRDEPYFDAFHLHDDIRFAKSIGKENFRNMFSHIKFFHDQRTVTQKVLTAQTPEKDAGSDLLDILARFRSMESSDPRDKVFGLLGLVHGSHHVDVDYSKTVLQIYTQTALSIIECSENLDMICQNPFEPKFTSNDGKDVDQRPSWVPDFGLGQWSSYSVLFAQRGIFNAGLNILDTPCTVAGRSEEMLMLKGVILDRVGQFLGPSRQEFHSLSWTLQSISGSAKHVLDLHFGANGFENLQKQQYLPRVASTISRLEPAETRIRAFWRTLARDCTAPPNMRRLQKSEIDTLDTVNVELLGLGYRIQTLRSDTDKYSGRSSFRFDPRDYAPGVYCCSPLEDIPHGFRDYTFNISRNDLFMMVRPHAKEGDIVVILDGGKVPMILREQLPHPTEEGLGTRYRIVGPAYVHGFMDGEADAAVAAGLLKKQNILIC